MVLFYFVDNFFIIYSILLELLYYNSADRITSLSSIAVTDAACVEMENSDVITIGSFAGSAEGS